MAQGEDTGVASSPAMAERLPKSVRTRQRILDAAAKAFRQHGYSARLSDIAEAAGIQTGSLYYHFTSREGLVAEVMRLGVEASWAHVRAAVDALPDTATPLDRLAVAIRTHTMAMLELSDYASAEARILGQVHPDTLAAHRRDQERYGRYWRGLFEAARAAGQVDPGVDLFVARMLALGAMNWTPEWFDPARGVSAEELADQAAALVLHGISTRPAAAPSPAAGAPCARPAPARQRSSPRRR